MAVSVAAIVVAAWAAVAGDAFSLPALLACEVVFLGFYVVGSLFATWRPLAVGVRFDLPLRLLVGYAAINTALLVLAWLSPFGIIANVGLLLAAASMLFFAARPERKPSANDSVGLWVIGLCLIAATLWCQDSLRPISVEDNVVVFKPWIDGFYHAVHLRIFGAGHGGASIDDFRMAGVPARLYHYGVYLTPALIKQASGLPSYTAFAGILVPLGVFFMGLGAYTLIGSFWGAWPGFAACAALMLLPDGAQQGMRNTFMSFHWLTQISPSATYGLAVLALAWLFVLRGCVQGNRVQLLTGWFVAGILIFYKLHFFIASALLLWLVPPLFFQSSLGRAKRVLWAAAALGLYLIGLVAARKVPGFPLLRLDGSGTRDMLGLIQKFNPPGFLRDFLVNRIGLEIPLSSNLLVGIPYVLLAALGLGLPLLVVLAIRLRKHTDVILVLFPLLVIANFLTMFFGLAPDFSRSTPDELLHRPVMVVYFVIVAWVGGATGQWLIESRRLGRCARPVLIGLAILLLPVPAHFGSGVQGMWSMRKFSPVRVPIGLVRAAEYMRNHGNAQDRFQDSQFDRTYVVAAMSDRRAYAARTLTLIPYNSERLEARIEEIHRFTKMRNPTAIAGTARLLGLQWFLLAPGDQVGWPDELVNHPAFELNGYRVYHF